MSRATTVLIALLSLTALLAGCHAPEGGDGDPGDGNGDGNGTGNGDGNGTGGGNSTVRSVRVSQAPPAQIGSGDNVTVCWEVEGEGTIPHTAIHWDNTSHEGDANATFQSYDLGMMFPDGSSTGDPAGYEIPGEFCTSFQMPEETIHLIAHAFGRDDPPTGAISDEHTILLV